MTAAREEVLARIRAALTDVVPTERRRPDERGGSLAPAFSTPEQSGMGPIEWQGYEKAITDAQAEARATLAAAILRERQRTQALLEP